jgi:hypothetical protein
MIDTDKEPGMKLPRPFVTKLSLATVLAALAALGWAIPEAAADLITLPPPFATTSASAGGSAENTLVPRPSSLAEVILGPAFSDVKSAGAHATLTYFLAVKHDDPSSAPVALHITSETKYAVTGGTFTGDPRLKTAFNADATIGITDPLPGHQPVTLNAIDGQFNDNFGAPLLTEDLPKVSAFNAVSGVLYSITLDVSVDVTDTQSPFVDVQANADPVISFAPGFDSTGFTLEFSPGVGNGPDSGSPTPEPSTLVLSSILFGTLGVVWA